MALEKWSSVGDGLCMPAVYSPLTTQAVHSRNLPKRAAWAFCCAGLTMWVPCRHSWFLAQLVARPRLVKMLLVAVCGAWSWGGCLKKPRGPQGKCWLPDGRRPSCRLWGCCPTQHPGLHPTQLVAGLTSQDLDLQAAEQGQALALMFH